MLTFLNGKYKLSNAAVQAMASLWFIVISVTMLIIAMFTYTLVTGKRTDDLPYAALASLGLVAVVAVISSMALYIAMWSYWFIVERSSVGVRLLWLLALLFGIHYGAAIYAYKVWAKNLKKSIRWFGAGGISLGNLCMSPLGPKYPLPPGLKPSIRLGLPRTG